MKLSPEQEQVVESWGEGMAVLAGAGSGKTTTLVIKCEALLRKNPDARFAAVSFTERSASDLREKLSRTLSLSNHWVMTIHGLCSSVIREFPRQAGLDGEEVMLSESEATALWERALDAIWAEEIPDSVLDALERLLDRESQHTLGELFNRMRDLRHFGALEALRASEDPDAQALACLGDYILGKYEQFKKRRGALDFNDLEIGARRALQDEQVRKAFQDRFDLVLVDEFQDTNPVQSEIIWRFVRPKGSNLCVVGDPKQSIYRFRDADVTVFEEFCEKLPRKFHLTWNFRSRPGILEFANQVCEPAFEASEMVYEKLVSKQEENPEFRPVEKLEIGSKQELAEWILGQNAAGVPFDDMALLLRKIRGNEEWLQALSAAGIPIAVGSGGLFWEDPRVRELVCFLKWWENAANAFSGAVFLRAPWVAVPDSTIDAWIRSGSDLVRNFLDSDHPLAAALRPFYGRSCRPAELLLSLLIDEERERELGAPLLGLWHRSEEFSASGRGFQEVVREFARAMEEKRRERDVPPPKNQGQITVLTLHGAKGLEFPHVILVDLPCKPRRAPSMPLLVWDRERGAYLGKRTEAGERDKKDPPDAEWRALEKAKELAESKRVFYVALTRPKERLVLVFDKTEDELPLDAAHEKDFWRGWIEAVGPEIPFAEVLDRKISEVASEAAPLRKTEKASRQPGSLHLSRHSVTEWNLLMRGEHASERRTAQPALVDAPTTQVDQRELGVRVHGCLEHRDEEGLRAIEQEVGPESFQAQPVIDWMNSHLLMKDAEDVFSEISFEVPVEIEGGKEILVGSIDRLIVAGGDYHIVDFKVTRNPKTDPELLQAYQAQLWLYAWALQKIEPEARGHTTAWIVNISPDGVRELEVPLDSAWSPQTIAEKAGRLLQQERASQI